MAGRFVDAMAKAADRWKEEGRREALEGPNALVLAIPPSLTHAVAHRHAEMRFFYQRCLDRLCVGALRYGEPSRRNRHLTRLVKELSAYRRTGNVEHLFNIANYAFLELAAPEHRHPVYDPTVESATRQKE